jgi:hypothetical protein
MQISIKFTGKINLMNSFEKLAKHPLKRYPMSYPYGNVRVDRKKDTDEQQADYQRPKPSRC